MSKLISIIIPVYNVKSYLEECLNTVLQQTYEDLEVILIDDGSNDGSEKICDSYAEKDRRIRLLHQSNQGLSEARNVGLKLATGKYIGFVDSDDRIDLRMYQYLQKVIESECADIAYCKYRTIGETEPLDFPDKISEGKCEIYTPNVALKKLLNRKLPEMVWCALYRREIIEGISFENGRKYEDVFWNYKVIGKAKRIALTEAVLYDYRQRPGSLVHSTFSQKDLDKLMARSQRIKYMEVNYPELETVAISALLSDCMNCYSQTGKIESFKERADVRRQILEYRKKHSLAIRTLLKNREITRSRKIILLLSKVSFRCACLVKSKLLEVHNK